MLRGPVPNWRPAHEPVQTRSDSIEGENTDMKLIAGSAILLTVAIASAWADAADGKVVFEAKCKMCHGADGKGNQAVGAPNLTDSVWLFGSSEAAMRLSGNGSSSKRSTTAPVRRSE